MSSSLWTNTVFLPSNFSPSRLAVPTPDYRRKKYRFGFLNLRATDGAKLYGSRAAVVRVTNKAASMEVGVSDDAMTDTDCGDRVRELEKLKKALQISETKRCSDTDQTNVEVSCDGSDNALSSNYGSFNGSEKEPATETDTDCGDRVRELEQRNKALQISETKRCSDTDQANVEVSCEGSDKTLSSNYGSFNDSEQEPATEVISEKMNIVFVAPSCPPWPTEGWPNDFVGGLAKALARLGHRVMVVLPRVLKTFAANTRWVQEKTYKVDGVNMDACYYYTFLDGVDFVFIDNELFRQLELELLGESKTPELMKWVALFCKAAIEVPRIVPCGGVLYGEDNLIFIANDWPTTLLPVYLKACYRDKGAMTSAKSVFVIHNKYRQELRRVTGFGYFDLPLPYLYDFAWRCFGKWSERWEDCINLVKGGILSADCVIIYSPESAEKVKTMEGGAGLHGVFKEIEYKLKCLPNGDVEGWDKVASLYEEVLLAAMQVISVPI